MAPKSLLRYIFRHGPNSKTPTARTPPRSTVRTSSSAPVSLNDSSSPHKHAIPDCGPESPLAYKCRSDSQQSSVLEDIEEEDISGSESNSTEFDTTSIAGISATLDSDIDTLTAHRLILASIDEARAGNNAHLDTLNTTLALLDALRAFSATIEVLRGEMEEKKCVCEEKLAMLEDVWTTFAQLPTEGVNERTGLE